MDALAITKPPAGNGAAPPQMQRARGRAEIGIHSRNGKNALRRLVQDGCGKARLPRIGNSSCEQAVLINTSGGITGGDALDWTVEVDGGASFTMTTQACEKIYAANPADDPATVSTRLSIGPSAALNWLPQETILFDGAKLSRTITALLAEDARLLMVEPVMFGRKAMGEAMTHGHFSDRWRIYRDGNLVHAEGFSVSGDIADQLAGSFAMGEHSAMATLALFAPDADAQLDALQSLLQNLPHTMAAATAWNGKLVARLVAEDSYQLRRTLMPSIALLNQGSHGSVGVPKVWAL
ncbi:MAG: urease accessory protein UreD [Pseudomonadota bacterium]